MRIRIKSPIQHKRNTTQIIGIVSSVILMGVLTALYIGSNGQWAIMFRTLAEEFNALKQEGLEIFLMVTLLTVLLVVLPFVSILEIFLSIRKHPKSEFFSSFNFTEDQLILEHTLPEKTCYFPYTQTTCSMEVTTYIRRERKGAVRRCIDKITLSFHTPETEQTIAQVGSLNFIKQVLDFAPRFQQFSSRVVSLYGIGNENERDLVQYVQNQIKNYQLCGKMLRYSPKQRREIRFLAWVLLLTVGGLLLITAPMLYDMIKSSARDANAIPFILFLMIPYILITSLSCLFFYRVRTDEKLEQEIKSYRHPF